MILITSPGCRCDQCHKWTHTLCQLFTDSEGKKFELSESEDFICLRCKGCVSNLKECKLLLAQKMSISEASMSALKVQETVLGKEFDENVYLKSTKLGYCQKKLAEILHELGVESWPITVIHLLVITVT